MKFNLRGLNEDVRKIGVALVIAALIAVFTGTAGLKAVVLLITGIFMIAAGNLEE